MFKVLKIDNFRRGLATNSSSTHSIIYKNEDDFYEDLNIHYDYYGRGSSTIAATREAKIRYIGINLKGQNRKVFEIMCGYYPEMKQYEDGKYGSDFRGLLHFGRADYLEASIDLLKSVIEDDRLVIVGGSDEEDFFYDEIEGRKKFINPDIGINTKGLYKNGNYWVHLNVDDSESSRIRFSDMETKDLIPSFPELVDLKITNRCNHNCDFCYQGSNNKGKHATLEQIELIVKNLTNDYGYHPNMVEFAVGGGNILLHPSLEKIFKIIKDNGHIVNVTITARDCNSILADFDLLRIFETYVSGIGISVSNINDLSYLTGFKRVFRKKQLTLHLIPELLGVKKTRNIMDIADSQYEIYDSLFLGYKHLGRALQNDIKAPILSDTELNDLFFDSHNINDIDCVNIDTTFANRYYDYLSENFFTKKSITTLEGEFSMYIDAVEGIAYKSSYHLDKPYFLRTSYHDYNFYENKIMPLSAFANIRSDNGLETIDRF